MNRVDWRQVLVFGVVALLVFVVGTTLVTPMTGGWGGGMMMGPGTSMMGGGLAWMWMFLVPLLILAALVLAIVWLARQGSRSTSPPFSPTGGGDVIPCPHCGRHIRADWRACPYCGTLLGSRGSESHHLPSALPSPFVRPPSPWAGWRASQRETS